jgi:hypothetical protein
MKLSRAHQEVQLKNQNLNRRKRMSSHEYYKMKYENYQRENSVKGWLRHIYLVCLSMLIRQPR